MKQLRISSCFNLHPRMSEDVNEHVKDGFRFYKENGLDAVDFGTTLLDLSTDESWRPQVEQILKDSEEFGIRCEMGHLPFLGGISKNEEVMENFKNKMHHAIDAAAALGIGYAVMHPNASNMPMRKYDHKEQYDATMDLIAPFVEHANRVGLNVVLENMRVVPGLMHVHRFGQTAEEICDIADALGMGICWDFGHANISGVKQSESLAYIGKRLKVIHVNDNCGIEDEHILPFTGNVDWRDAMHGLALAEYEGLFNFELNLGRVPASMRKAYTGYVLEAAKELMSYIE
ncbi:MAG: sugar phosphate isomerase/epimerase [Clostridia bacterium]|nr:sugar phosphate isomerase/epimerase [Clostridia bacterium]